MNEDTLNLPEVLASYIVESQETRTKNGRIWASELGVALGPEHDGCTLAFWLKCKDEPTKDKKPGELLMLKMGDLVHDYIAELIGKAVWSHGWAVAAVEKRVTLEVELEGDTTESVGSRLDILLEHRETGRKHVVDIKTKRGGAFRFLNEAKPGNILQVQAYMKGEDADTGSVLYVDREGQNFMREFDVPRDDSRPETAIRTLAAIRDNPIPPAPVGLRVVRNVNKGPDSVKVELPWQIQWCDLQSCACKKALPCKKIPKGIVAKLHEVDELVSEVRLTDEGQAVKDILLGLLHKAYPGEYFFYPEGE